MLELLAIDPQVLLRGGWGREFLGNLGSKTVSKTVRGQFLPQGLPPPRLPHAPWAHTHAGWSWPSPSTNTQSSKKNRIQKVAMLKWASSKDNLLSQGKKKHVMVYPISKVFAALHHGYLRNLTVRNRAEKNTVDFLKYHVTNF